MGVPATRVFPCLTWLLGPHNDVYSLQQYIIVYVPILRRICTNAAKGTCNNAKADKECPGCSAPITVLTMHQGCIITVLSIFMQRLYVNNHQTQLGLIEIIFLKFYFYHFLYFYH